MGLKNYQYTYLNRTEIDEFVKILYLMEKEGKFESLEARALFIVKTMFWIFFVWVIFYYFLADISLV